MKDGQLIDFERADVVTPMIYPPRPTLVVTGQKPHPDMEVTLVPLTYVSQPPYHGIQVVGSYTHDGPHVSQPIANVEFTVELDLDGHTGSVGIEVIGVTSAEQITVPGPAAPVE